METKYTFTKMTTDEFEVWLSDKRIARTILYHQQHHTYNPDYALFDGNNHFELQKAMKNYHVSQGWDTIGQHFTVFPDGIILTGRDLEKPSACIYGMNAYSVCVEALGNFDTGKDIMIDAQKQSIVRIAAAVCKRFSISVDTNKILYHHWFNLNTGERNNGSNNNKSCPGSAFFGGNKVADCQNNFIPLIQNILNGVTPLTPVVPPVILKYVCVTASSLNIRTMPDGNSSLASDRDPATLGSVLRVYAENNGWYKISNTKDHWVSGRYTKDVLRAIVNASPTLNVRNLPGTHGSLVGTLATNQEIFVVEQKNGWSKISMEEKWVNTIYLTFSN